jgi:hypothetical protein
MLGFKGSDHRTSLFNNAVPFRAIKALPSPFGADAPAILAHKAFLNSRHHDPLNTNERRT